MKNLTNRKSKDTLFRLLFSEKQELLGLYNAVRGTHYENVDDLEINTLENAIYMAMKNDISFVIGGNLMLYEHQSTWSGNMPLRNLLYIANLYSGITADKNIYSSKTIPLPSPQFIVFYNGTAPMPDYSIHKLSDAYACADGEIGLELNVIVLNINLGYNVELMEKCKTLQEYAYYVEKVREYRKTMPIEAAVERAIATCIENNVLGKFLRTHRAEVKNMSIFEYDAEKHIAQEKEESYEDGRLDGKLDGMLEGKLEGEATARIQIIRKQLRNDMALDAIADLLDVESTFVIRVKELIVEAPEATDEEIAAHSLKVKNP